MAVVTFRLFAAARASAGQAQVDVPAGPVRDVVAGLAAGRPQRFAEVLAISALVLDGTRLDPTSPAALAEGSIVDVLPPFAGG